MFLISPHFYQYYFKNNGFNPIFRSIAIKGNNQNYQPNQRNPPSASFSTANYYFDHWSFRGAEQYGSGSFRCRAISSSCTSSLGRLQHCPSQEGKCRKMISVQLCGKLLPSLLLWRYLRVKYTTFTSTRAAAAQGSTTALRAKSDCVTDKPCLHTNGLLCVKKKNTSRWDK